MQDVGAEPLFHGAEQQHLEFAAVQAELWDGVAGVGAARLA